MALTHGSLFSGIGGFDLGFERAGIKTSWQVERDFYARRVLARRFPAAFRFPDIRDCGAHNLRRVDIISGGFPCQDISNAGTRAGIEGERSSLWSEFIRIVRLLGPRYIVVENVSALLNRGAGQVLGDLSESGYDAEWDCLPASAFGAPHRRDRIFIVAYPAGQRLEERDQPEESLELPAAQRSGLENSPGPGRERPRRIFCGGEAGAGALDFPARSDWWAVEPDVGRVVDGLPHRVDRLKGLGNSVVPQIAEWIGGRILRSEVALSRAS